jgi:hypothetical protein
LIECETENNNNLYKKAKNNLEIKTIRIKLENIIFDKLRLNDEIENKYKFYRRGKNKN